MYVHMQRWKWAREHCLIQASLGSHKTENIMFELHTVGEVCHTFLSVIPHIQTNGTECSQTDGWTDTQKH